MAQLTKFQGIARDITRTKLPDGYYQRDVNGTRESKLDAWRPRFGYRHTALAKFDNAIESIAGFETGSGQFGVVLTEGANVQGFVDVVQQDDAP